MPSCLLQSRLCLAPFESALLLLVWPKMRVLQQVASLSHGWAAPRAGWSHSLACPNRVRVAGNSVGLGWLALAEDNEGWVMSGESVGEYRAPKTSLDHPESGHFKSHSTLVIAPLHRFAKVVGLPIGTRGSGWETGRSARSERCRVRDRCAGRQGQCVTETVEIGGATTGCEVAVH